MTEATSHSTRSHGPDPARLRWGKLALWLPLALLGGWLIGWASLALETFAAPLILLSLVVGLLLGAALAGLARLAGIGHRPTFLAGALAAALAAVAAQHWCAYRQAVREAQTDAVTYHLARQMYGDKVLGSQPVPPDGFSQFLRWKVARGLAIGRARLLGSAVWLLWLADALALAAATLTVGIPAARQPFCDRCQSAYRMIRRGAVAAAQARRLAAAAEIDLDATASTVRYRLVTCAGGCGPIGLEIACAAPGGERVVRRYWVGRERLPALLTALDGEEIRPTP